MNGRPNTAARRRLEDEFYKVMSRFDNAQWKEFARSKQRGLGLPDFQIDDIRSDYHNDIREQKYQMLALWQRRNGKRATVEYLEQTVDNFFNHVQHLRDEHARAVHPEPVTHDVGNRVPEADDSPSIEGQRSQSITQSARVDNYARPENVTRPPEAAVHRTDVSMPAHTIRPGSIDQDQAVHGASLPQRAYDSSGPSSRQPRQENTRPKQTIGTTQSVPSANSTAAPFPIGFPGIFNNSNISINVIGSHAKGIENNFYYGEQPKKKKQSTSDLKKFKEYCSKIERVDVVPSTAERYESHWENLDEIYKVSHKPKGAVLIINNSFPGQNDAREGSEHDVRHTELLWNQMGCKVFLKTEMKAAEAIRCLTKFANTPSVYGSDFIVVVIMSHGGQVKGKDVFYGDDREAVEIKEALDIFNNKNARRLQGVPKLFFFQVCRGMDVDLGANADPSRAADISMQSLERMIRETVGTTPIDSSDAIGFEAPPSASLPTVSDTMISFATQAGQRAFRNPEIGSWYINAITNVFMRHAHEEDVVEMMTKVNNAVAGKTAHNANDPTLHGGKEMSSYTSTLRKKLYLFPGFPQDNDDEFM